MSTYYSTLRSDSESRIKGYESRALTALAVRRSGGSLPVDIGGSLASRHVSGLLGGGNADRAGRDIGTFQSWVYACVNSIATRVAGQPWMAGELKGAAKKPSRSFGSAKSLSHPWLKRSVPDRIIAKALAEQELEMLASHPALDLMDQPNKLQRRWEFLYMSAANLALTGVCYWIGGMVKDGKNGERMEIWAVPSSMLEPIHKDGLFSAYKWRSDMFGSGVMDDAPPIPAENVARTYMANPSDLTGVFSPLRACMRAVRTDGYIQDTQEQLFSHGMTPRLAVIVGEDPLGLGRPVRLNDVQRRQVTRAIEELWSWTVNNGRPAILDALIKDVKRIDPTAQEFEWQTSGEIIRQRIFATYRVNKFIVGDSENMNRAQVVEAQRQFADNVVNPICDSLSETACSWISPMFGGKEQTGKARRLWIWVKPVSVQDPDMESRDWAMARKNGDVDRNEFRAERLGLPPKEDETQKSPLVETVGGVQGAIGVLTAIGQGMIERDSAVVIFREFYGLDPKTAEKLVGEAKERPPAPPQPPPAQPGVAEQNPIAEPAPEQMEGESVPESEDKAIMPDTPEPMLTRKALEAAHVKRQTESERRASETLADFFRGRIEEVARAVAKQRVKLDPDKADAQAERIVSKAFHADAELKGLVRAIAPHMAAAFVVGAGAELELNEKAAKARSARLKGLKYDPSQPRDEGGQWGSGGASGNVSETSGVVPEERPTPKSKSEIAKSSAVRCDAEIQRYAEDVNEVQIAGQIGGEVLKDNEPADVTVEIEGKTHGIELKTVVVGKNDKLTMKKEAQDRKRSWSRKNKATFHTVVLDDRKVFNANGPGKHDLSKRKILYRRGFGSFRLANMHEVKDMTELKDLMGMDRRKLPVGAKAEEVLS